MRRELETIPVLDAFRAKTECALCSLQYKSQQEFVRYYVTEAVMAPDLRILINETGFCHPHYSMLMKGGNRLGVALMTHSHIRELRNKLNIDFKNKTTGSVNKRELTRFCAYLSQQESLCLVCERVEQRIERYTHVIIRLWSADSKFRTEFNASRGFCVNHMVELLKTAVKTLKKSQLGNFVTALMETERQSWDQLEKELLNFISNFDHTKTDLISTETKQSLTKAVQKLSSSMGEPDRSL